VTRLAVIRQPSPEDFARFLSRPLTERDRYADVGMAMRSAIELALADDRLAINEARLLLAGLHMTGAYSRLAYPTYRDYLFDLARVNERQGQRGVNANHERGAMIWSPARGRGSMSFIGLPGWHEPRAPLVFPLSEKVSPDDTLPASKGVAGRREKVSSRDTPTRSTSRRDQTSLFDPDCAGRRCFMDPCDEPVVAQYAGQYWCARHYEEQVA
jgi:hypothetical protein